MPILSNNPPTLIELDPEDAKWLLETATENRGLLLSFLGGITSRDKAEKVVNVLESWKRISEAVKKGMEP